MVADRVYSHFSVPFRGFRGLQAGEVKQPLTIDYVWFQSPCGVLGVCRSFQPQSLNGPRPVRVSVPLRGFRGLQEPFWRTRATRFISCFSPLAGF